MRSLVKKITFPAPYLAFSLKENIFEVLFCCLPLLSIVIFWNQFSLFQFSAEHYNNGMSYSKQKMSTLILKSKVEFQGTTLFFL